MIGPFDKPGSPIRRWSDGLYKSVIAPLAREFGYEAKRSIDFARPRDITSDLVSNLLLADLVVADLTYANPNVYYELAIRHAIERPFIHVIQDGESPSFDIRHLDVLSLPFKTRAGQPKLINASSGLEKLRPYFASVFDGTASYSSILSGQQVGNAMSRALAEFETSALGLQKLAEPKLSLLPTHVQKAIMKYAVGSPLYYTFFHYNILLRQVGDMVDYSMRVEFEIQNASAHHQTVVNRYPTSRQHFLVHNAVINGRQLDTVDPGLFSGDALVLRHVIEPGETAQFCVSMEKRFAALDSDLFTAYLYPADRFTFEAENETPNSLLMWLDMLHGQGSYPERHGSKISWAAKEPLLPYQGVRLLWKTK